MGQIDTLTGEPRSAAERLLEDGWEARARRRASRRELAVEASAAILFVGVAVGMLLLSHAIAHLPLGRTCVLFCGYALIAQIEFPVGVGHVVPTQLMLIPMVVLLPPGAVPMLVALALVGNTTVDWALRRSPARRILTSVPDAWHAVGPAAVLLIAHPAKIGFAQLPLMAIAFAASCVVDLVSSLARMRLAGLVPNVLVQMRVIGSIWAVDASLAPLGLLAAVEAQRMPGAVLFVMPLGFLLWMLARDRRRRIQQAHRRLKLVEHERTRLQSAVRRLGDAFAAKLELDSLLDILLNGSVEALDAAAGCLQVGGGVTHTLQVGSAEALSALARAPSDAVPAQAGQMRVADCHVLAVPVHIASSANELAGVIHYARRERQFGEDEIELIVELIGKAELAAAEILAHASLREQVLTDALTGLGNRRKLSRDLGGAFDRAASGLPSLLLLFDLDGFKTYNDTFGHLAGDALLERLGVKLRNAVATHGDAYRLGGDEFCAWLALAEGEDPDPLIQRAAEALTEAGQEFSVRASFGFVVLPHEADSADHALQLADERMYVNKRLSASGARNQARDVLMRTMQLKQPALDEHSSGVGELAVRVARQLGMGGEDLDEIARAAELHDVGKVGIPDAILNKPAELDPGEWEFMYQHTILGERILHAAPALRPVARLVRASHERWDGAGYPDGLRGEQIPLGARIVAVCDAYEAMTTDRTYSGAISHEQACEELRAEAGRQFDPEVVAAFLVSIEGERLDPERNAVQDAAAHVRSLLAPTADDGETDEPLAELTAGN